MQADSAFLIAVTGIAVKGLEVIYELVKSKIVQEKPSKTDEKIKEVHQTVNHLKEFLTRTDDSGNSLVYFPRRLVSQQDDSNELLIKLTYVSETTSKTLERLTGTLEGIVRVLSKLEERSGK